MGPPLRGHTQPTLCALGKWDPLLIPERRATWNCAEDPRLTTTTTQPHWWHDTLPGSVGETHGAGREYVVEASPIGWDGTPTPRGTAGCAYHPGTQRGKMAA